MKKSLAKIIEQSESEVKEKKPISIRATPDLWRRVRKLAAKYNCKLNPIVLHILEKACQDEGIE